MVSANFTTISSDLVRISVQKSGWWSKWNFDLITAIWLGWCGPAFRPCWKTGMCVIRQVRPLHFDAWISEKPWMNNQDPDFWMGGCLPPKKKKSLKQFEPSFHVLPMPRLKTSNGAPAFVTKGVPSVSSVTKYAGVTTAGAVVLLALLVLLVLLALLVVIVVESAPSISAPWRRIRNSGDCFFVMQNMGPGRRWAALALTFFWHCFCGT